MKDSDDIRTLKGIGDTTQKLFNRLGICTVRDLLYYFPRGYQSYLPPVKLCEAKEQEIVTLKLFVLADFKWKKVRNLSVGTGLCSDGQDRISITWFNAPYMKKRMTKNCWRSVSQSLRKIIGKQSYTLTTSVLSSKNIRILQKTR